ncbi:MAG: DUF3631 domain-containing protein [Actinophytocola sp.]|uniref:DUF3631 domain-containing protein n=1 Tax=Actinophytocola sp. TaxID=1872138 RepID=UPI003C75E405
MSTPLRIVEPQHLTGAALLDAITGFVSRFIVFPNEHCAPMLALWYAHTHAAEHFYVTPRLVISSAEPGSGKTLVIEVGQYLVAKPEMVLNASTPAVFRMVANNGPISLLWDEVDAIFTSNGGTNEDLRAMLNAGYKRTASVARCVGDSHSVQRFPVYSPVALVGLAGGMPPTITTRAITIHMRRKKRTEKAEEFRERVVQRDAEPLRDGLSEWIGSVAESVGEAEPTMPPGVANRSREIWEPLLAIADAAGGHWPTTARKACAHFVQEAEQVPVTTGVRLLADLRTIFTDRNTDRLATVDILAALADLDEAPWGDINGPGRPIDARRLARELALYRVAPGPIRIGGQITKGYVTQPTKNQEGLADAWSRYLSDDQNSDNEGDSWEH